MRRAVVGRERGRSGRRPGRRGRAFPTGEDAWPRRLQLRAFSRAPARWNYGASHGDAARSVVHASDALRNPPPTNPAFRTWTPSAHVRSPAQGHGTAGWRDAPEGNEAMTHATATRRPEGGMGGAMTANDIAECDRTRKDARDLRNTPGGACTAVLGRARARECRRGPGSGLRTGAAPFKHEHAHGEADRAWSPRRRWFGSARAGLGTRAGSRTPLRRGAPPEASFIAARLRRGGHLQRFSLLGRAARLLAAVLALAVPLLAALVLSDAAPAQAQTSQPTPDKLVLELRRWPHRDHIAELVFIPGPHTAGLTVLAHYQLRWTAAACC